MSFLAEASSYSFRVFQTPAPIWDYWYLTLLPLCLGIAVVYKSIRCRHMHQVPRQATTLFGFILLAMVATAALLVVVVKLMERAV